MPVLMVTLINNQLVMQYGAVPEVPPFGLMLFARRILGASQLERGSWPVSA
jgi:hypothetical protein